MKRIFLIFFAASICLSCNAHEYFVNENYDSMNFEIINNNKVVYELNFERFCGYQQIKNQIFFIDCSKSKISEYGELCYFDCDLRKLKYTGIFSGSSFYITTDLNYLITSSLYESKAESDIEDIFDLGEKTKNYPLDISVYNFNDLIKVRNFTFIEKLEGKKLENYYVEIIPLSDNEIKIQYGIYDSTNKIDCGVIQLKNFL